MTTKRHQMKTRSQGDAAEKNEEADIENETPPAYETPSANGGMSFREMMCIMMNKMDSMNTSLLRTTS